jgi:hypothetical protein
VAQGVLHREVVDEPYDPPYQTSRGQTYLGHRTVYYTPKGEEWRIPASKLIWDASSKSGGWNEYFERLEGMLFGYEDWQNDWWIKEGITGGGFGGRSFCCAVTAAGLAWIEAAGFRALPPIDRPALTIMLYDRETEADLYAAMLGDPDSAAVVRFNMFGDNFGKFWDLPHGSPWDLPAGRIAAWIGRHRRQTRQRGRSDSVRSHVSVYSVSGSGLARARSSHRGKQPSSG